MAFLVVPEVFLELERLWFKTTFANNLNIQSFYVSQAKKLYIVFSLYSRLIIPYSWPA